MGLGSRNSSPGIKDCSLGFGDCNLGFTVGIKDFCLGKRV